jgi:hypothetical protein
MVARLVRERESLQAELALAHSFHSVAVKERDYYKVRLSHAEADAEQAIHNEALNERQKIARLVRTAARASGVSIGIDSSLYIARLADAIENAEHDK